MNQNRSLLSDGLSRLTRNKRYIVWFYVLNILLAWFGTVAFATQAHEMLDHSLAASGLVHGFDLGVFTEMMAQPEFGSTRTSGAPAMYFASTFFVLSVLFMPGVILGYASTYRLPREDFFRACGRNLWRFIRLLIIAGIVMGIVAGVLFGIRGALIKAANESTNELLPFYTSMACLLVIFLLMSVLRIWFDLAQADVVLSDRSAVRRSLAIAFRHTWRGLGSLLGSYVVTTIIAAILLIGGLWFWIKFVPPASVVGAFFVSQFTLLLLLVPRFWQRGVAVTYYQQHMVEPIPEQSFSVPAIPARDPVVASPAMVEPAETSTP